MCALSTQTYKQQQLLSEFIRKGKGELPEGMYAGRENKYRSLVMGVVTETLETAFPIFKSLLTQDEWEVLVTDFFATHACQSACIWELPREFAENIITQQDHELHTRFLFLQDLLLFEWLEIELFMAEDIDAPFTQKGNVEISAMVLNPEFRLVQLTWPVHTKPAAEIEVTDKGNYFLFMYREPDTFKIKFINLSAFLASVLHQLAQAPATLDEIMEQQHSFFAPAEEESVRNNLVNWLTEQHKKGIIKGYRL